MKHSFWTSHAAHINLSRNDCCPKREKQNIHLLVQQEWSDPKPHNQPQPLEQVNMLLHTTVIKFSTKISNLDISIYREISLIKSIVNIINKKKKKNHVCNLYVFQEITIHLIKTWISKMLFHTLKTCWITFIG